MACSQLTVPWATLARCISPSPRYVLSPRAFEALQLKLPDVLRKNGDKPEATVDSKIKQFAMAVGKGFATEAGKQAASGLLSIVINWVAGGGAAKG